MTTLSHVGNKPAIRDFFNGRAAVWDETVAEKDTTKLEDMAGRLDIEPGTTVLDVGTGTGVFVPYILRRIGEKGRLVCLDFAAEMLKMAESKGYKGDIKYLCADIEQTELDDSSFDTVVCYSCFPHIQDKPKALNELYRLLKEGGRVFIGHTSSRSRINEIHRQVPLFTEDILPGEEEMRQLLLEAGFSDVTIEDDADSYLAQAIK